MRDDRAIRVRENGCVPHENPDDPVTPPPSDPEREDLVAASGRSDDATEDGGGTGSAPIREEAVVESEHRVRVRRTPRYGRFMLLGGAVFAVAAFIATYSFPQGAGYDRNTVFGFVLLGAVAVGVGIGALAAIIASAATKHTERTVVADRIDVRTRDAADGSAELPDLGELPADAEAEHPKAEPAVEHMNAERARRAHPEDGAADASRDEPEPGDSGRTDA
jgi:hypothetical protein